MSDISPFFMGIRFGPIEPLQLIFEIINGLVIKGVISVEEGEHMIKKSLDPSLSEEEKEKILDSLRGPTNPRKKKNEE